MAVLEFALPAGTDMFLHQAGWGGAEVRPLAGDASFRRYFRAHLDGRRAVLMDAPPPHEDPRPFIAMAQWLCAHGFAAPQILHADLDAGLVLIEDLGDARMRETIDAAPNREAAIYTEVTALLAALHEHPAMPSLPPYDRAAYLREVDLFTDWYCPALNIAVETAGYHAAWNTVLDVVLADQAAPVTVLRDYHAENIMLLEGAGVARLGLLDFQDALAGHTAYDLVSMLQDARRDVQPALEQAMLAHYQSLAPFSPRFEDVYHILGAQRNVKILGIFTRLWKRDNKPHYRAFQTRVWRYLERDLAHPALAPVKAWFDAHIPPEKRAAAWVQYEVAAA